MNLFVTGTDTEVGKTLVACALLRAFASRGLRAAGMKPVAAGTGPDGGNEDVRQLLAAGNVSAPQELINPYLLRRPLAPHIAARFDGVVIELEPIVDRYRRLCALADAIVVEGVGGFRVPLSGHADSAQLAVRLALPVILVVGLRLGCINHALLTAEAIAARGLRLAGWVGNQIDPGMDCVEENVAALRERLPAPLLGFLPRQRHPDPACVARMLALPES